MAEDIEVHHNPKNGLLSLSCESNAFSRIRAAVIADEGVRKAINESNIEVRAIWITLVSSDAPPVSYLKDRLVLLGCAIFALVVRFPMIVGIGTIAGWWAGWEVFK